MRKKNKINTYLFFFVFLMVIFIKYNVYAQSTTSLPSFGININSSDNPTQVSSTLQLIFMLTIISLAPSILILMTCFTRIIIALHFMRSALGTQQIPPNQILIGLALFLTLFIMSPIFTEVNEKALIPYQAGELSQEDAIKKGMEPIRKFMFLEAEDKDMALFLELSGKTYKTREEIPNSVLIPSFILGELTKGFIFGLILYIPFIVIDMVVASILMAMGMMMLPPAMISLPFKILIFVMSGGWTIVIENLTRTFRMY